MKNSRESLLEREKESGSKFCPCRRVTKDEEENKKIICPCVYHQQELEKFGHCLCGLFVR
jgi:ferredoxin-thioredoxin reductase catalytic subunit